MATTVDSAFSTLISNLTPSTAEAGAASSHRATIAAKLESSFGVSNFFETGSRKNGTSIRYHSDVDYFASIPVANQQQNSAYMLQKVKDVLQDRFPNTPIYIDTPAVVCAFGDDGSEKIEVVPAYYIGKDDSDTFNVYKIPAGDGLWMKSSPKVHNTYVTQVSDALNKKVKPLIRLIKAIKYYNNIDMSSFYLELRVAKWASNETAIIYPVDVRGVLKHLVDNGLADMRDPKGISGLVAPTRTESQREAALSRLNSALIRANNARDAEQAGKTKDAFEWWDKAFNGNFPSFG